MGANERGQGTGRTQRTIVPDIVFLVVMPGFSGNSTQQKHDDQQRNDTGEGCAGHKVTRSRRQKIGISTPPKEIAQGGRHPGRSRIA